MTKYNANASSTYDYLLSNAHSEESSYMYEPTWIMFVEPISGERIGDDLIEVYKYIDGHSGTSTTSRKVSAEEARAEWKFWIGLGFDRITDKNSRGWKLTEHIKNRRRHHQSRSAIVRQLSENSDWDE